MEPILILILVGLTSLCSYLFGLKRLMWSSRHVAAALNKMLECIGMTLIFFALNLLTAVSVVLAVREIAGVFVSVYTIGDPAWLALSFLQGLIFQWWRELSSERQSQGSQTAGH